MQKILHYPTLKTVLMIEDVLKKEDLAINRTELKKKLPTKIMDQTLNIVLKYLENRGMIMDTHKGIIWTYNPTSKFQMAVDEGIEI
ncbi:MAG: hypothetical protein DRN66_00195 [Candidatus Nanohalarchaeota archaeon]|nr:MAG: hypothetical protein DRN66_00195 [Candidatus Nanohaloarchaeota archaeon]